MPTPIPIFADWPRPVVEADRELEAGAEADVEVDVEVDVEAAVWETVVGAMKDVEESVRGAEELVEFPVAWIDRLRSFIQYDYSIGLRGLVGSRTASPPALYQIG